MEEQKKVEDKLKQNKTKNQENSIIKEKAPYAIHLAN